MKTNNTDVVAEYLREVDQRLAGLPVLQRRELLADLAAHIATERDERNLASEGEVIEVLERLGTPEAIAAAAHEEAGTRPRRPETFYPPQQPAGFYPPSAPPVPPARARSANWTLIALLAGGAIVVLFVLCGFLALAGGRDSAPEPAEMNAPPPPTPSATAESRDVPAPTVTG
ncbi:HAAS signaling domain-containing protein [Actinoplanes sp. NPDC048796]|uniref:HAAS signaling domain-containing protein n=1 Tax=unclassified Actinoplanes TaxID=2626549 RepID=UPI0033D8EA86